MTRCSCRARLLLGGLALVGCATFDPDRGAVYPTPVRGVVVSDHPLATEVGRRILERGGNAADAAVATALALCVVHPEAAGLGGGGLALWAAHDPSEEPRWLDFLGAPPGEGREAGAAVAGRAQGVGVPGMAAGLWRLASDRGSLSFRDLATPAIQLAREGFEVGPALAARLGEAATRAYLAGAAGTVFHPEGRSPGEGHRLQRAELARTLELLVTLGPEGFYRGRVGEAIVSSVRTAGGSLAAAELARYEARWEAPLIGWFRGQEILTTPLPSHAGVTFLQVLAMLDGFPLDEEIARARREARELGTPLSEQGAALSARAVHWWIEALRIASDDRALLALGSLDAITVEQLLAPTRIAAHRVALGESASARGGPVPDVRDASTGGSVVPTLDTGGDAGTSVVTVLDADGNAVVLALGLRGSFGSGLFVRDGGFLLGAPWTPGVSRQRDAWSARLAPIVVRENGRVVRWAFAARGGAQPVAASLQVFLRCEVYGQPLRDALVAPRLEQRGSGAPTQLEPGWDPLLVQGLETRRHALEPASSRLGSVAAIRLPAIGGEPMGASDAALWGCVGVEGVEPTPPPVPIP